MRKYDFELLRTHTWDNETIGMISKIYEHKGRQQLFLTQQPQKLETLVEIAKIQSIESSNKIEGISTTQTRIRQICMEKTTPKNRSEKEISGYRDVLNSIHENFPYIKITPSIILQFHRDLYKYSNSSFGGKLKSTQNYIVQTFSDGSERIIFTPTPPYETENALHTLCENFNKIIEEKNIEPLLAIPVFINDFLCIHPFSDGNGRMSRLLTTLILYKLGFFVGKYISLESKIERTKQDYYLALSESDEGWNENKNNPEPFVKYFLGILLAAYRDFEERIELISQKIPALEMVRQAAKKKIGKFTKNDILELCPTLSHASVENSLKRLVEENFIERHGAGRATFYVCIEN